jgi:hypothetical protein
MRDPPVRAGLKSRRGAIRKKSADDVAALFGISLVSVYAVVHRALPNLPRAVLRDRNS